jgi:hypothetical protein
MVYQFGGCESIFLISHTNRVENLGKVAHEPGVACGTRKKARWSYERGAVSVWGRAAECNSSKPSLMSTTTEDALSV